MANRTAGRGKKPVADTDSPWRLQRERLDAKLARHRSRVVRALDKAKPFGVPFESVYRPSRPTRGASGRVVFRYGAKGERLILELDESGWELDWNSERRRLDRWSLIETADGEAWIVTPPTGGSSPSTIPHPYRPHPGLKTVLFDGWYGAMTVAARPERSAERSEATKAAQIIKAVSEAVERGGSADLRLLDRLETQSGRYLKSLGFKSHPDLRPWHGQGLKLILDRPSALLSLANHWFRHLSPRDDSDSPLTVVERFIRDLREGASYSKLAPEIPNVATAGNAEVRRIVDLFTAASDAVREKRRSLLCTKCAPGTGGLGRLGERGSHYAAPIPGDKEGWGCKGTTPTGTVCGPIAEGSVKQEKWELSTRLVCDAAVILGYPRGKARHLFSFEDKRVKQSPRTPRSRPLRKG